MPQIAKALGVSYHELVQNDQIIQNNYGEIKDNGIGNTKNVYLSDNTLIEKLLDEKDEKYNLLFDQCKEEQKQKEYFKEKYYRMKEKVKSMEK